MNKLIAFPIVLVIGFFGSSDQQLRSEVFDQSESRASTPTKSESDSGAATASIRVLGDSVELQSEAQRLTAKIKPDGLCLTSGTASAECLRVVADAVGREGHGKVSLAVEGTVTALDQSVVFERPGLLEEYTVGEAGVRQDFVITSRPPGSGDLVVSLEVTGGEAMLGDGEVKVRFNDGSRELSYGQLKVLDARGRELPASFEVMSSASIAVRIQDTAAEYPVRIDPTFSQVHWSALGAPVPDVRAVNALAKDNVGNIFIGGSFPENADLFAQNIGRWDGNRWRALGLGVDGIVYALATDSTNNVYAGGSFSNAGGLPAGRIAKWDGTQWINIGDFTSEGSVRALICDSAGNLYAGTSGGGVYRRTAQTWTLLGRGTSIYSLTLDASGNLYAGGAIASIGGASAANIAKWDGTSWSALGTGVNGEIYALTTDTGGKLYAGGKFTTAGATSTQNLAVWNGSAWSSIGNVSTYSIPSSPKVLSLAFDKYGYLVVGGDFVQADQAINVRSLARWNGTSWSGIYDSRTTPSTAGLGAKVNALLKGDDGKMYAGGSFVNTSDTSYLATFDGSSGFQGVSGTNKLAGGTSTQVLAMVEDASGNLYIGGDFTSVGGITANRVAKWNGTAWQSLDTGMNGTVHALALDAAGNLYAGGVFTTAGATAAPNHLAKWNGTGWSVPSGVDGVVHFDHTVRSLAVSNTNTLAVGFSNGIDNGVGLWDGATWRIPNYLNAEFPYPYGQGLGPVNVRDVYTVAFDSAGRLCFGCMVYQSSLGGVYCVAREDAQGIVHFSSKLNLPVRALATDAAGRIFAAGDFTNILNMEYLPPVRRTLGAELNKVIRITVVPSGGFAGELGVENVGYPGEIKQAINALTVDGEGTIYAGGVYSSDTSNSSFALLQWDGTYWQPPIVQDPIDGDVNSLLSNGTHHLYAGGKFYRVGGHAAPFVAKGYLDRTTEVPSLTLPASSFRTNGLVSVAYTLPEAGLVSSVKLNFVTAGVTTSVVMAASQSSAGPHSFDFDSASPASSNAIMRGPQLSDGTYSVQLVYSDALSNTTAASTISTNVTIDRTPPTFTLPTNLTVEATGPLGSIVSYSASATDNLSGVASRSFTPTTGSTFPIGTTTVNAAATDGLSNSSTGIFTITVRDTIAPVIIHHSDVTVQATAPEGIAVSYAPASATDAVGVTSVTYSQDSGTVFPLGSTQVTITARDAANNSATQTFTVHVLANDVAVFVGPDDSTTPLPFTGASFNFGNIGTGTGLGHQQFTVKNLGSTNLDGIVAKITGTDATSFPLASLPASPIAPGAMSVFEVRASAKTKIARTASIHLTGTRAAGAWSFDCSLSSVGVDPDRYITVTNDGVSSLSATSATLNGKVYELRLFGHPNTYEAYLDYGFTSAYGTTVALHRVGALSDSYQTLDAALNLLQPHKLYHARMRVTGPYATVLGPDVVFTTANRLPVAAADPVTALPSGKVSIRPLSNDTDADNDTLSILSFTAPAASVGTVAKYGNDLVFTPSASFNGGTIGYTNKDGFGGTSSGTITLNRGTCVLGSDVTLDAADTAYDLSVVANAPWSVIESVSWLSFTPPATGDSSVHFIVTPNATAVARSGTVTIGGEVHHVTQNGIAAAPVLSVPVTVPNAAVSASYDLAIPTQYGPVTYTATGLPTGMSLSNATGRITGYPTVPNTYHVSISAKNVKGSSNTIAFDIVVLPFPSSLIGAYSAVIEDSSLTDQLGGIVTLNITGTGTVTGTLKVGATSSSVNGRLNTAVNPATPDPDHARLTTTVARAGKPSVVLTVNMNSDATAADPTDLISGNVTLPGSVPAVATLSGSRHIWSANSRPASDYAAYYTLALQAAQPLSPTVPQGDGYLTMTVTDAGTLTWSGQLADGTTLNPTAANLWRTGDVPLFALLYSGKGSLNQKLRLAPSTKVVSGTPHWIKQPQASTVRAYAGGFATTLQATGAAYLAPSTGFTLLNLPTTTTSPAAALIAYANGGIESVGQFADLDQTFTVTPKHQSTFSSVASINPAGVKLSKLDVAKGLFTSTMTLKDANPFNSSLPQVTRVVTGYGVLLPTVGGGAGTGFFLLPQIGGPPANVTSSPQKSGTLTISIPR